MNKALIAIRSPQRLTGATRNALEQVAYLASCGYEVHLIGERLDVAELSRRGCVPWSAWRWPIGGAFRYRWFDRQVQRWLREHGPALVISHGYAHTSDILVCHNVLRLEEELVYGRTPTGRFPMATLHDEILREQRFRFVVCNSELMARDLAARYGVPPSKTRVVYQGVDLGQFNTERRDELRARGRAALPVDARDTLVGLITSGNFEKRNVGFFLELARDLLRQHPELRFKFVVVGKDEEFGLARRIAEMGLTEHCTHLAPRANVQELYHALDVFVLPAKLEEYGRVVLEAMACGVPTLVAERVGAGELLRRAAPDCVLPTTSQTSWSARIAELAARPDDARALGRRLALAAQDYSQANQARALFAVIDECRR